MTVSARFARRLSAGLLTCTLLAVPHGGALAAEPPEPPPTQPPANPVITPTEAPRILGTPRFREKVKADPGGWEPRDVDLGFQWYADGRAVAGADESRYSPRRADIGRDLVLEVTATYPDAEPVTVLTEAKRIRKGTFASTERPRITGHARYGHTLTATAGEWSRKPDRLRYQWLRNGNPIPGATGRRHHLGLADFGQRLQVRVTARKESFRKSVTTTRRTPAVTHRVPARRTVTYSVQTRGAIHANVGVFRKQAQATFDDPRGWRSAGVAFRRVASGGHFTLVLAEASQVPSYSSVCSSQWSCRVGRYVVINQTRWQHASPMWNQRGRSLRDYRHMVVNHETGHWLGHGHSHCPGNGALAPVMMQQSKGLGGCVPNPWPTAAELRSH